MKTLNIKNFEQIQLIFKIETQQHNIKNQLTFVS